MAIFTPGPAVGAISGSVGGSVFSHNKGGPYIRNRTIPTKATSEYATNIKALLTQASQDWQGLTAERQSAWREWAKTNPISNALGQSRIVPGHVAYIRVNMTLMICGYDMVVIPPVIQPTYAPTSLVLNADIGPGTFDITYTPTPCAADGCLMVWAALVDSHGISYVENLYKLVAISPLAQASPMDIQTQVEERFGLAIEGQVLHVRVARINEGCGLPSAFAKDSIEVTDTTV